MAGLRPARVRRSLSLLVSAVTAPFARVRAARPPRPAARGVSSALGLADSRVRCSSPLPWGWGELCQLGGSRAISLDRAGERVRSRGCVTTVVARAAVLNARWPLSRLSMYESRSILLHVLRV